MITHWNCEICGRRRHDRYISVISYPLKDLPGAERNVKYCNDDEDCVAKARGKAGKGEL